MQPQSNLYRIGIDHLRLIEAVEEMDGELTPEVEQQLQITEKALQETAISFAGIVKHYEASAEAIDEEIKRLQKLKKTAVSRKDMFKKQIADAMNLFHVDRITSTFFTLSFKKADSVLIEDERLIDLQYKDQAEPTISKERIKDALKIGKTVNGASLVTNRHLQIK